MNLRVPSPAQKKVYVAIATHFVQTGSAPSYQSLADKMGLTSLSTIFKHVHALEKLGMLKLQKGRIQNLKAQVCPTCGHRKTA